MEDGDWGWTSYKKTDWRDAEHRPLYIARFFRTLADGGWETSRIIFATRRPVVAMREIIRSGKHPSEFNGETLDPA